MDDKTDHVDPSEETVTWCSRREKEVTPLMLLGDVRSQTTGDDPPIVKPQVVTPEVPPDHARVAVVRTHPRVIYLGLVNSDEPTSYEDDYYTPALEDGTFHSEFWLRSKSLAEADKLYVLTRGEDLMTMALDVEYRGWKALVKKKIRDFKHRKRVPRESRSTPRS